MNIPVMEIFGPTIQGEGRGIGTKTLFVRTAGCDYKCAWCDSAFTWDGTERATQMPVGDVVARLDALAGGPYGHVTISGGNPALVGAPMAELVAQLHAKGVQVAVETQGSVWQDWLLAVDDVTLSPKPPSSGMTTDFAKLDALVAQLAAGGVATSLKVVVFDEADLAYAKQVFARYRAQIVDHYVSVGNPAPGADGDVRLALLDRLRQLFDWVIADPELNHVRPLPQLHTLVWNNKRGV